MAVPASGQDIKVPASSSQHSAGPLAPLLVSMNDSTAKMTRRALVPDLLR